MNSRRHHLFTLGGLLGALAGIPGMARATAAHVAHVYDVVLSEAEWKNRLSPQQYEVLRRSGTERPYTSPLNREKRAGIFHCAGCDRPLFSSAAKFESGTGWPSFWQPLAATAVHEESDTSFGVRRTGVLCQGCGGHLGHVFDDGPKPTGLRYCMNGVAMKFQPA
ncbi:peptide-methionine (R)-S-oxide reductase MsrB [Sphingomonas sp. NCPPB 2930]